MMFGITIIIFVTFSLSSSSEILASLNLRFIGIKSFSAAILDRDNPSIVKYRCGDYMLTPEKSYETTGFVPNVCFPVAALTDAATGRIAIYYGCADTVTGLCFTTVDETVTYIKSHNELSLLDKDEGRF